MAQLKKKHKLFFLGSALVLPSIAIHAAPIQQTQAGSVQFVTPTGPPPGFEESELNIDQTNYISLYYGDTFLGNAMGTYNDTTINLGNISDIVNKIPGVLDAPMVAKALSGKIATNSNQVCEEGSAASSTKSTPCNVITPDIAGVIFDPNTYRATIFVNPKYLNAAEQNQFRPTIPDSTAGLSYIANNMLSIANTTGSQTYSLNNLSIFGAGNNTFNVTSNVTDAVTTQTSNTTYTLQNMNFTRLQNGNYYQVGMITPDSSGGFLGGPTVLGASIQNYGVLPENAQGSPLVVFLPLPSQVAIYRNGYLISTQSFNAGKQNIDTSSFPTGSYEVTLQVTNNTGQTTSQTQFFVKQSTLPPAGSPNYQVSLGVLQSNTTNAGGVNSFVLPKFLSVPLLTYNQLRKISSAFGLQTSLMTTFNRAYLSETLNYYGMSWQFSPGVLVSNNKQFGWLFNFMYLPVNFPNFQLTSNNQRISNSQSSNISTPQSVTASNFSPVAQSSFQSTNSANWTINAKTQVSFSQSYNKSPGAGGQTQYGLTFSRALYSSELFSLQLSSSVVKANGQSATVSVSLNSSFDTVYDINVGLGVGYSNANTITNTDGSTYNVYKPNYNETITKTNVWGPSSENTLVASANLSQSFTTNTNSFNVNYVSSLMAASMNFSNTKAKQYTNVNGALESNAQTTNQLSGNILNNIAITSSGISSGYQGGNNSGIMANIVAPSKVSAEVYINAQDYGSVSSDDSKAFFVPPYQTYTVAIQPNGATQYGFDTRPKIETVYAGNIANVKWVLSKEYVLFAQIVDEAGKPLVNALMLSDNPSDFNTTDDNGYIQANLSETATSISFKNMNGDRCTITLDPAALKKEEQNDLVVLNSPLVCKADKPAN